MTSKVSFYLKKFLNNSWSCSVYTLPSDPPSGQLCQFKFKAAVIRTGARVSPAVSKFTGGHLYTMMTHATICQIMATNSTSCRNCGHSLTRPDIPPPLSPFPGLKAENCVLPSAQAEAVRASISAAMSNASQLKDEISRIETVLRELHRKHDELKAHADHHREFIAPIAQLPSEILSEIFLLCTDRWMHHSPLVFGPLHERIYHLDKSPLLISSICRKWNNLAFNTPKLWASFSLFILPNHCEIDLQLMRLWLTRSAQCPLSISLEYFNIFPLGPVKPLIEALVSCSDRWQNIRLSVSPPLIRYLSPARNHMPQLQWLFITNNDNVAITDTGMNTFEIAPQLRHLKLTCTVSIDEFTIPWSQLRTCDLGERHTAQYYLNVLSLTPNIESCEMIEVRGLYSHVPHAGSIQLTKLHTLTITMSSGEPGSLLHRLRLPALRELSMSTKETDWPAAQFMSFLSHFSLSKLSLTTTGRSRHRLHGPIPDDMVQILQACPDLTELYLGDISACCLSDTFLARFTRQTSSDSPELVPALQKIYLDYHPSVTDYDFELDVMAFANAVRSRDGLTRATIDYSRCKNNSRALSLTTRSHLRLLRDQGDLDIRVPHSLTFPS